MTFTKDLTPDQLAIMQAKVGAGKDPTIEGLLNNVLDAYIKQCGVDVGMDPNTLLQKKIDALTDQQKNAIITGAVDLATVTAAAVQATATPAPAKAGGL